MKIRSWASVVNQIHSKKPINLIYIKIVIFNLYPTTVNKKDFTRFIFQ